MKKALIVDRNGAVCIKDVPEDLGWEWMAENLGCEMIEIVRPRNLAKGLVIIVDEEGKLKSNVINVAGSWLYGTAVHGDAIVGDIMILREEMGPEGAECKGMDAETAKELAKDLGNPLHLMSWAEEIRAKLMLDEIFH